MIDTTYAVNCLKQGFKRYVRSNRINATIDCGDNYVSFYVKDFKGKQYLARSSNHHLKMQHLANKDEPWKGNNISIVFITPNSPQDTRIRGRVRQTHYGSIKPFSVTTYQYDNTILDEMDLRQIFYAIMSFLNGNGYKDPLAKTPKAAKVIPRNANIKSYKEPSPARNISVDRNGNYVSANAWGADYVTEDNNRNNTYYNMKRIIRLTESDLHKIVKESVNRLLREDFDRAAFENACDDLYYGYDFNYWRKQHSYLDPITADKIWHAAFKKMSEDPSADFVPHSIESYDDMMRQNDERLNVQPNDNGRYPDENLNVLDSDGSDSLYAQGGGPNGVPHKLKGMKAIKMGGMGLGAARDEYEKNFDTINKSKSSQRAFKQGRIGNERPLHRKGSLNRAFDD